MKIVVTANGADLDAPTSPIFGRCTTYILVDLETMAVEAIANPAGSAGGGAGVQAAQFVVGQGAQAVVTGNVGPNAFRVLQSAGVPVFLSEGGTVRQAVVGYREGRLSSANGATVAQHSGGGHGTGGGGRRQVGV